jgi:hypothetical protein
MNGATPKSTGRELDCRTNDRMEARLLWNSLNHSVSVSAASARPCGENLRLALTLARGRAQQ